MFFIKDFVIYCDMDGCVADWEEGVPSPETRLPGFFISRNPNKALIEGIKELAKIFTVKFLTATYPSRYCREEKTEWARRQGLGHIPIIFVPFGDDKSKYVSDGPALLIDDYTKNLLEWSDKPEKYGLKYLNGINHTHQTWKGPVISHQMTGAEMVGYIKDIIV